MRIINQNGSCEKPPVNYDNMFHIGGFLKELKKQMPGLTLTHSHIYKTVKIIEKILDESISLNNSLCTSTVTN